MEAEEMELFGIWSSPYVLRVIWALNIKKIKYKYIEEDLNNKSNLLLHYNPVYKKVPVLVYKGKPICESMIIVEFIEETWKNDSIFPKDPYEKAKARFLAKFVEDKLSPPMWRFFTTKGKDQEEAYESFTDYLAILERELEGKEFFGGENIGFVDILLGCMSYVVPIYEEITDFEIITKEKFPLLHAWMQAFLSSDIVRDNLPPRDELLYRYRKIREAFLSKDN
ncbi:hypothetical protein LUZ60_015482 [Juncus effusus]|nr:hypothetical protein LUZ60_015482 [Juncus effusus]